MTIKNTENSAQHEFLKPIYLASLRTRWNTCLCDLCTNNQYGVMVCITMHYDSIGITPLT